MKLKRSLLSLALVFSMSIGLFAGCSSKEKPASLTDKTSASTTKETSSPTTTETTKISLESVREEKMKAEPEKITFLCAGFDGKNAEHPYTKAIAKFEKETGKKVEIVQTAGGQLWNDKIVASIAAGDPVDVFDITVPYFLTFYQNNYIEPLNDYIDLNNKNYSQVAMDKFVKFNDKYYVAYGNGSPYVMFYNKDILSANGFDADEPMKLYKEGKWNWESFKKIASECNDPKGKGIVGFENMFNDMFLCSNNTTVVKVGSDNKYELNIKDPAVKETLEMIQDIFFKNKIAGEGYVNGQGNFISGKAALHGAYSYDEGTFAKAKKEGTLKFEYGVAPFPAGPSNTVNANPVWLEGFAISIGSKAPYTAGKLIDTFADTVVEESQKIELLPGSRELYDSLSKNPVQVSYTDGILANGFGSFYLYYAVQNGEDINKKIDEFTTTYQQMIDQANSKIKSSK